MMNAEKKLTELRQQVDRLDTSALHQKIEDHLKAAWLESGTQDTTSQPEELEGSRVTKKWNWRIWTYALSASGVAALALITTTVVKPTPTTPLYSSQKTDADVDSSLLLGSTSGLQAESLSISDSPAAGLGSPIRGFDYELPPEGRYSYGEEGASAQLLQESVSLSVDVKDDMLEVIHQLREQIDVHQGYLVNIYYYDMQGTVDIKLPADQLSSFEEFLKKLDVNHELEIANYNVVNVSEQVVLLDENIKSIQKQLDEDKAKLTVGTLTETQKKEIQDDITANEEYLKIQHEERLEKITEYNLVTVRVNLNEYSSFWEGNYTQYNRSTFGGMIQYELSKMMYTLIRSSSSVIRFVLWLAIYSVIFLPAFLIVRSLIRKIIKKIKNRQK